MIWGSCSARFGPVSFDKAAAADLTTLGPDGASRSAVFHGKHRPGRAAGLASLRGGQGVLYLLEGAPRWPPRLDTLAALRAAPHTVLTSGRHLRRGRGQPAPLVYQHPNGLMAMGVMCAARRAVLLGIEARFCRPNWPYARGVSSRFYPDAVPLGMNALPAMRVGRMPDTPRPPSPRTREPRPPPPPQPRRLFLTRLLTPSPSPNQCGALCPPALSKV